MAVRANTESLAVRFGGGGPMDHKEAFGSSYVARGGQRVAIDAESFMDKEAAGDEIAPGSLSDGLSSARVLCTEDVEGVLLPDFDGDGRAGRWPATVVPSARMRAKQSGCGGGGNLKDMEQLHFLAELQIPSGVEVTNSGTNSNLNFLEF
jgi:hypothetical protein